MRSSKNFHLPWLDRPLPLINKPLSTDAKIFCVIIVLAAVSRLVNLGDRPLSHDESIHIYYSYLFSQGQGYQHTPLSHGPLQFHLIGLIFYLFRASDFWGRFPHAIVSVLSILLVWNWRRYLGRAGSVIAAILFLISPYMLYYGRYARNESFVVFLGLLTLFSILRYLETGQNRYLYLLIAATALHFTIKETIFIYTAQAMVFLGIIFLLNALKQPWRNDRVKKWAAILLISGVFILSASLLIPVISQPGSTQGTGPVYISGVATGMLVIILAFVLFFVGYGWKRCGEDRAWDLLISLGVFVLPHLAAFPASWLGWDPLDYHFSWPGWNLAALFSQAVVKTAAVFLGLCFISIVIGICWGKKKWLYQAVLFWGIYILFYTTIFTNPGGFFTGTVGSLGYWLAQQAVARGGQPWYYYLLIQVPIYEFLPLLGVIIATFIRMRRVNSGYKKTGLFLPFTKHLRVELLFWWMFSSLLAYSLAGEKMPWLTVHIALPMILLAGWGLGILWNKFIHQDINKYQTIIAAALLLAAFFSSATFLIELSGSDSSAQEISQPGSAPGGVFLLRGIVTSLIILGLVFLSRKWQKTALLQLAVILICYILAGLTIRTSIRASFTHADDATEYLVYAHGSGSIKDLLQILGDITQRTGGENRDITIAVDTSGPTQGTAWPMKWYLRNFPSVSNLYSLDPPALNADVLIIDSQNLSVARSSTGNNYYRLDFIRMVWPNQDYFALTWARIIEAASSPEMRLAIFNIWFDRDYSLYAGILQKGGFELSGWLPADKVSLFIKKEIFEQSWELFSLRIPPTTADTDTDSRE